MGEHFPYATSMGLLAATVLVTAGIVIWFGPEARGVSFMGADGSAADEIETVGVLGSQAELLPSNTQKR
jgi:ABC-type cobalt transport system substrate-binding protein